MEPTELPPGAENCGLAAIFHLGNFSAFKPWVRVEVEKGCLRIYFPREPVTGNVTSMKVASSTGLLSADESEVEREGEQQIIVIDDDDLSREVLALVAMEAGFAVKSFASGEEVIASSSGRERPAAILADIQMPGISGPALATQLRQLYGDQTTLFAMSGSHVNREKLQGYDGFLLKPFSAHELKAACDRNPSQTKIESSSQPSILNEAVFENFARSMPAGRVFGLYKMCLDDSGKRLGAMRKALEAGDDAAYRSAAHAIKGGCGMVGAVELARLAAEMESAGLPAEQDVTPLDHFVTASARLGRMLDCKASSMQADITTVRPSNC